MALDRRAEWGVLILLALVFLWSARSLLHAEFVYEDDPPTVSRGWRAPLADLELAPRRVTNLTLQLQAGQSPTAFHEGNVALQVLNGVLLFLLLRPFGLVAAYLAVTLWWLHPLTTEVVAYVAARADLLVITAVLLMLLAVRVPGWLGVGLVAFCAGLTVWAKESGVVAPLLLAIWCRWRGIALRRYWPIAVVGIALAVGLAWMFVPRWATWVPPPVRPPLWLAGVHAIALLRYLTMVIVPRGFTVAHDWDLVSYPLALVGLFTLGLAVIGALWRPRSAVSFAVCWMVAAVLPRFVVPLPQVMAEHHVALSFLGVCLALGGRPCYGTRLQV